MRTVLAAALLLLAVASLAACRAGGSREVFDRARLASMEADIDRMIADRRCSTDGACKTIAFGDKPCGGPWGYKVYSAERTNEARLRQAVEAYNRYNATLNRRYGWISDCSVANPPAVECADGQCGIVMPVYSGH